MATLPQHFVARLVAVRVVEFLEEVDVQEHQRAIGAFALPFAEAAFQLVVERAAIRQAGERIGPGLGFVGANFRRLSGELLFGLLEPLLQLALAASI